MPRLALAAFLLVLGVHAAEPDDDKEDKKEEKKAALDPKEFRLEVAAVRGKDGVTLRPNVRQRLYVKAVSTAATDEALTVLFRAAGKVEATGKVDVPSNGDKEVRWLPAAPRKEPLDGPFDIALADKDGKPLGGFVPLRTMTPYEYLSLGNGKAAGLKKLALEASAKPGFFGPAARVALDIPPDRIKGPRRGSFSGFLSKDVPLVLDAEPIEDTDPRSKDLRDAYSLQVDGIKRGLFFRVTTKAGKSTVETDASAQASLALPRVTRPTDKLAAEVLTSGNIAADDRVVVELLATPFAEADTPKDKYVPVTTFVGPRVVKMLFDVDAEGALHLRPVTAEHVAALDLSGVFGKTKVRVGIYDKEKAFDAEGNLKPDAEYKGERLPQVIQIDDTPPKVDLKPYRDAAARDTVRLIEAAEAERGRRVIFRAVPESVSGITDVRFYVGKPTADGKLPAEAVKGVEEGGDPPAWLYAVQVPADAKSPLEVTVHVTNELGLSARASVAVEVVDPVPEAASIAGRVFEMDVPIPDLPVLLLDPEGTEIAVVRSGPGGAFAIPVVPPGRYALFARREQTNAKAMLELIVRKPTRAEPTPKELKEIELRLEAPAVIPPKTKLPEKPKKARITGFATEGDRPQAGLPVRLIDVNARVVKEATTGEDGAFELKDLEPGRYAVEVHKSASRTKARRELELKAGQEETVGEMKLFR